MTTGAYHLCSLLLPTDLLCCFLFRSCLFHPVIHMVWREGSWGCFLYHVFKANENIPPQSLFTDRQCWLWLWALLWCSSLQLFITYSAHCLCKSLYFLFLLPSLTFCYLHFPLSSNSPIPTCMCHLVLGWSTELYTCCHYSPFSEFHCTLPRGRSHQLVLQYQWLYE